MFKANYAILYNYTILFLNSVGLPEIHTFDRHSTNTSHSMTKPLVNLVSKLKNFINSWFECLTAWLRKSFMLKHIKSMKR